MLYDFSYYEYYYSRNYSYYFYDCFSILIREYGHFVVKDMYCVLTVFTYYFGLSKTSSVGGS